MSHNDEAKNEDKNLDRHFFFFKTSLTVVFITLDAMKMIFFFELEENLYPWAACFKRFGFELTSLKTLGSTFKVDFAGKEKNIKIFSSLTLLQLENRAFRNDEIVHLGKMSIN